MPSIQIWKDKIVLRQVEELHESLENYSKYNERFSAYLLSLGKQNLQRIFKAYGKIPVTRGQSQIDALKLKLTTFKSMGEIVQKIKSANLDFEIPFKMQPLGEYQHLGTAFLIASKRAPLFADCGVGKTFMVLVACECHIKNGTIPPGKTLICGKLTTLETGWLEDCEKFTNLKAVIVWEGSSYKRKEKLLEKLNEPADIYITNHDTVRVLQKELAEKRFEKVVVDESTILKSYRGDFAKKGGAFGKALMDVAKYADWRVIMSGTPAPNCPSELWGQFKFLDPEGFLLEPVFKDFKCEYLVGIPIGQKLTDEGHLGQNPLIQDERPERVKWVCPAVSAARIKDIITPFTYQVAIRDVLEDLPERTVMKRTIPMSSEQTKHYLEMEKELSTWIKENFVSVDIALTKLIKLRQVTGGFLIDQEENPHAIASATKLSALDDLLEELGNEKVVIYAQYRWEVTSIISRYKDQGVVSVYGDNTSTKNLNNIKKFINDPGIRLVILHPRSAAHGITLTVARYMIFYSQSYSAEENYQCIARIERASQKQPMFIYYLLSKFPSTMRFTIDEIMYKAVQKKQRNQDLLIDQKFISQDIVDYFRG